MKNKTENSWHLFEEARKYIPGGVNSPVRAFKAVGGHPVFISRASGSKVYDIDTHEYIDYVGSWGPMILGHAHPEVVSTVQAAAENGLSFGASTKLEVELAKLICQMVPSIEHVRMVSSGTEATMSALRLARGYKGRDKIIKFEGCYHGHVDSLLVKAGSGATTLGIPTSAGIPTSTAQHTITLPFNDISPVRRVLQDYRKEIACIIVEPIPGNMGLILPQKKFLENLRDLTEQHDIILIFDEVITGFRVGPGGAQGLYNIRPDLTCLGKILGGGLPVGAFGGKKEIMQYIAPLGPVYQAGTLSGNPLAVSAGLKTLQLLADPKVYEKLENKTRRLTNGLVMAAKSAGIPVTLNVVGSMFTLFFTSKNVTDYTSALTSDQEMFARYFQGMLEEGISLPPSQFETNFVSSAHTDEDIDRTISAAQKVFNSFKA
ncbi:MAG: glutamate-1-semialdehyde 2,1-aminomutase [bacterium]